MGASIIATWFAVTSLANEVVTIAACTDPPSARDVPWAIARTVSVEVGDGNGTGVVVSSDGVVLTAAHVVNGASQVNIRFEDGVGHEARVVRVAESSDLALLAVEATEWPCMPIRTTPGQIGGDVIAVGSPGGRALSHSVSKGIVSGYRDKDGVTLVQTDAAINAGNSGGPLVDANGELLGVVSFKLVGDDVEGLGFAVASTDFQTGLGIRWGTRTVLPPPETKAPVVETRTAPLVSWGTDAPLDLTRRYVMTREPAPAFLVSGATLSVLGIGTIAGSWIAAHQPATFTRESWRTVVGVNAAGWGVLALGGASFGLSIAIPSRQAPVVPREEP